MSSAGACSFSGNHNTSSILPIFIDPKEAVPKIVSFGTASYGLYRLINYKTLRFRAKDVCLGT